jgi:hypothetical protein
MLPPTPANPIKNQRAVVDNATSNESESSANSVYAEANPLCQRDRWVRGLGRNEGGFSPRASLGASRVPAS